MAWLRDIKWPFHSAIFDGEACAGDGHEGIQAVFTERKRAGGDMAPTGCESLSGVLGSDAIGDAAAPIVSELALKPLFSGS